MICLLNISVFFFKHELISEDYRYIIDNGCKNIELLDAILALVGHI